MKIIRNNIIPFKGYKAFNFFGLILFARKNAYISKETINHEEIHTAQMKELFYILFYVFYLVEWLIRLILSRNFNEAYNNISFEREAYSHAKDFKYLKNGRY
jgi:hypothetical protein